MVDILDFCVYLELFAAIPFVGHVIPHASPSPLLPTGKEKGGKEKGGKDVTYGERLSRVRNKGER